MFYNQKVQVAVVEKAIVIEVQTPNFFGRLFGIKPKWKPSVPHSFVELTKKTMSWKGDATTSSVLRWNNRSWYLKHEESIIREGLIWLMVFRRYDGQKTMHVFPNLDGMLQVNRFDERGNGVSRMLIYPTGEVRYLYGAPSNPDEGLEIKCD